MGFELRSSRAITIENITQLIAQLPLLSEQSLSLREDASCEYALCAFYLKEGKYPLKYITRYNNGKNTPKFCRMGNNYYI